MSTLTDLLDELDMESWLDHEGIKYRTARGKSGLQANIRECPICGNSKWKVYFGLETGRGNCFVCGETFNKWKFISAYLDISGSDVFAYLKSFMETQGWKPTTVAPPPVAPKATLKIPKCEPIPINGRNLKYLQDRGITVDLCRTFDLRYSHDGKFWYQSAEGKWVAQDYSRRVIIPVLDLDGKLVSFQGRDITGTAEKKYLFPPEFASTGSVLYNAWQCKGKRRLVLGEGVFDCIAVQNAINLDPKLASFGAIASFGKKLGREQIDKLKALRAEGMEELLFMWDAEPEAMDAAVEAALECRRAGIRVSICKLPAGCDPNEVEPAVVQDAIWNAVAVTPVTAIELKLYARRIPKIS